LQELLTLAVVLEGGVGVVKAATISLNDQAGVSPKEVGLESTTADTEGDVDLGRRKSPLTAHAKEQPLQIAASPLGLRMKFLKDEAKPRNPTATTAVAQ
jgi:hypothetical protein